MSESILNVNPQSTIQIEEIVLKKDNFDEVAKFLGATKYQIVNARQFNMDTMDYDPEFTITGGFFSLRQDKTHNLKVGQTIIRPILNFRDVTFIEPVDE